MSRIAKFIAVIFTAGMLGAFLGFAPSLLRSSSAGPTPQRHGFRTRFDKVVVKSPAPGVLYVGGIFRVGDPSGRDEIRVQQLQVRAQDGTFVVDNEIGKVGIAAGEHSGAFEFEDQFLLPAGKYEVQVLSYVPGSSHTENGVSQGPYVGSRSIRHVAVK